MSETIKDANGPENTEERCECGKLLWRVIEQGFELKCNRCKRIHVISLKELNGEIDLCEHIKTDINPAARDRESNAQTLTKGGA